jgi:addiction module RelE/StbE family toxin
MSFRVVRTLRAAADIRDIADYLAEYSPPAAGRFREAMQQAQERLAAFPNSGAPGFASGTRRLVIGDYIVSYRVRREIVQIFAVRHAKRRDALA